MRAAIVDVDSGITDVAAMRLFTFVARTSEMAADSVRSGRRDNALATTLHVPFTCLKLCNRTGRGDPAICRILMTSVLDECRRNNESRQLWSVSAVKCLPRRNFSQCSHAHKQARASFSLVAYLASVHSVHESVLNRNAFAVLYLA